MTETRFEELMVFPADFTFRVIASSSPDLVARCTALLAEALGRAILKVDRSDTASGRWSAVHITVHVVDAREIDACYAILGTLEGIRMVL